MPLTPMQIQAPPGPLVDADWLEAHLDQPGLRVLDVRGRHPSSPKPHAKRAEYATSHIPGAVLADWEHDLIDGQCGLVLGQRLASSTATIPCPTRWPGPGTSPVTPSASARATGTWS